MNFNSVGFIGLGIMGRAMARHIVDASYSVSVFNRSIEKTEELKKKGARVFTDPLEVLATVEVCCSCVTNAEVLYSFIRQIKPGMRIPKYWIDFSTIAPRSAVDLHNILKDFGCVFIDAPVTGGDIGAQNATLAIMVGAEKDDFDYILPLLNILGKTIVHIGGIGRGQLTKCVNQLMIGVSIAAMSEGMFFSEQAGLKTTETYQIVRSGSAGSWALENYFPRVLNENYAPGFYARDMLKDLRFVIEEAQFLGIDLPVTKVVKDIFESFVAGEGKDLGNHALIQYYRNRAMHE